MVTSRSEEQTRQSPSRLEGALQELCRKVRTKSSKISSTVSHLREGRVAIVFRVIMHEFDCKMLCLFKIGRSRFKGGKSCDLKRSCR
jgi:hypothetical protein